MPPLNFWLSIVCLHPEKKKKNSVSLLNFLFSILISGHHIREHFFTISNSDPNFQELVYTLQIKGSVPQDFSSVQMQLQIQVVTCASD